MQESISCRRGNNLLTFFMTKRKEEKYLPTSLSIEEISKSTPFIIFPITFMNVLEIGNVEKDC